jgi:hypothetical protein
MTSGKQFDLEIFFNPGDLMTKRLALKTAATKVVRVLAQNAFLT